MLCAQVFQRSLKLTYALWNQNYVWRDYCLSCVNKKLSVKYSTCSLLSSSLGIPIVNQRVNAIGHTVMTSHLHPILFAIQCHQFHLHIRDHREIDYRKIIGDYGNFDTAILRPFQRCFHWEIDYRKIIGIYRRLSDKFR